MAIVGFILLALVFGFMFFGACQYLMFKSPRVGSDGLTHGERCRQGHNNIFGGSRSTPPEPVPTPEPPLTLKEKQKQEWKQRKQF